MILLSLSKNRLISSNYVHRNQIWNEVTEHLELWSKKHSAVTRAGISRPLLQLPFLPPSPSPPFHLRLWQLPAQLTSRKRAPSNVTSAINGLLIRHRWMHTKKFIQLSSHLAARCVKSHSIGDESWVVMKQFIPATSHTLVVSVASAFRELTSWIVMCRPISTKVFTATTTALPARSTSAPSRSWRNISHCAGCYL